MDKPVEKRWHISQDGRWKWKGDTSSDEFCGHLYGYYWYYNLVADDLEKQRVADHFMVMQWEWLMTPPRSEVWAVCLGMAFFFTWFVVHFKFDAALRVAVFAGLGGGFGFAFGNFLQVIGNTLEIPFNFWNVMEYSLGFFGGVGMAYGTFASSWPKEESKSIKISNLLPLLLVALFIPFVLGSILRSRAHYPNLRKATFRRCSNCVDCSAERCLVAYSTFGSLHPAEVLSN